MNTWCKCSPIILKPGRNALALMESLPLKLCTKALFESAPDRVSQRNQDARSILPSKARIIYVLPLPRMNRTPASPVRLSGNMGKSCQTKSENADNIFLLHHLQMIWEPDQSRTGAKLESPVQFVASYRRGEGYLQLLKASLHLLDQKVAKILYSAPEVSVFSPPSYSEISIRNRKH